MPETTGADHSSAVTSQATAADHSEPVATEPVASEGAAGADHSSEDFEKELDAMWGIEREEEPESAPEEPEIEEEPEAEPEEPEEPEAAEEPEAEPEPSPYSLRVNFMGNAYDLPEDEARKYVQIGMNAGHLQNQYEALKPLEGMREAVETLALFQGKPVEEVIRGFSDMGELRKNEVASLVEQGHDQSLAEELFDTKWAQAKQRHAMEKMKSPQEKGLTLYQKEQIQDFARFRPKEHEDISNGKEMPKEVVESWKSGVPLTTAWLLYENKAQTAEVNDLKNQIKALEKEKKQLKNDNSRYKKNEENRKKAPSRKKGTGGGAGQSDIFGDWSKY